MSGAGGSRGKRMIEEEHENHERWLVTYADMLTVLMALFIVMFAMSVVDQTKFEKLKQGLDEYFGHGPNLLDGGSGLLAQDQGANESVDMDVAAAVAALHEQRSRAGAVEQEKHQLEKVREQILQSLKMKGLEDSVRFRIDERGLVVTIVTDQVLFELGSATLLPAGRQVLDGIGPALVPLPNPVTVEGHTDNLPIRGGRFPSNWELSTERSTSVLRYLIESHRLPPKRMSAAGYADQRPLVPNQGDQRALNRRVEVIVRSTAATAPIDAPPVVKPAGKVDPSPVTDPPADTAPPAKAPEKKEDH